MAIHVDIPEGEIRNAIAVAVAESFSEEKRDALLRDIIRAHLQYRENTYDKETLLGKAVGRLVRAIASEEITKVVEQMRPDIERIVEKTLGPSFRGGVLDSLETALKRVAIGKIDISVALDKYDED